MVQIGGGEKGSVRRNSITGPYCVCCWLLKECIAEEKANLFLMIVKVQPKQA